MLGVNGIGSFVVAFSELEIGSCPNNPQIFGKDGFLGVSCMTFFLVSLLIVRSGMFKPWGRKFRVIIIRVYPFLLLLC